MPHPIPIGRSARAADCRCRLAIARLRLSVELLERETDVNAIEAIDSAINDALWAARVGWTDSEIAAEAADCRRRLAIARLRLSVESLERETDASAIEVIDSAINDALWAAIPESQRAAGLRPRWLL